MIRLFSLFGRFGAGAARITGRLWRGSGSNTFTRLLNIGTFGWLGYDIWNQLSSSGENAEEIANSMSGDSLLMVIMPNSIAVAMARPPLDVRASILAFQTAAYGLMSEGPDVLQLRGFTYLMMADYLKETGGRVGSLYNPDSAVTILKKFADTYVESSKVTGLPVYQEDVDELIALGDSMVEVFQDGSYTELPQVDFLVHLLRGWADVMLSDSAGALNPPATDALTVTASVEPTLI